MLERQLTIVQTEAVDAAVQPLLQVAFATSDLHHVDQHFGSALGFAIYEVTPTRAAMLRAGKFNDPTHEEGDKLEAKLEWLHGCDIVVCEAIGSAAIRRLHHRGTRPVRVNAGSEIYGVVLRVQQDLRDGTATWLEEQCQRTAERIDALASMTHEEWRE